MCVSVDVSWICAVWAWECVVHVFVWCHIFLLFYFMRNTVMPKLLKQYLNICLAQCWNHDSNANVGEEQLKGKKTSKTCQSTLTHVDCTLREYFIPYNVLYACMCITLNIYFTPEFAHPCNFMQNTLRMNFLQCRAKFTLIVSIRMRRCDFEFSRCLRSNKIFLT